MILDTVIKSPIKGVCWFLDELLYHSYHNTDIKDPVFIISASHSGSTQIGEYLEGDKENFTTLMCVEGMFPFIWAGPVIKMLELDKHIENQLAGEELRKRHNFHLFKCETLEIALGLRLMTFFSHYLGTSFMKWGFLFSSLSDHPTDKEFPKCFLEFSDLIMKKLTYHLKNAS